MEQLNLKKLEVRHAVNWGGDFQQRNLNGMERFANVDDVTLKRAPANTHEGVANALILAAERAEQKAIKANPPRNCKGYVERSDYPITSLYSDFKDLIEEGEKDWEDYREERRKWRRCRHMYCLNYFPIDKTNFKNYAAKRRDSKYCDSWCRSAHRDAERRFAAHGSYLPEYYYLPVLSESAGDRHRRNEFASEEHNLEEEASKQRPLQRRVEEDIKGKSGEVISYNIYDLSEKEIKEKNLQEYCEKLSNSRGMLTLYSESGATDASFLEV